MAGFATGTSTHADMFLKVPEGIEKAFIWNE